MEFANAFEAFSPTIAPQAMTTRSDYCIKACEHLLRSEQSAFDAYDKAIANELDSPLADALRSIRWQHSLAADKLASHLRQTGGGLDDDFGDGELTPFAKPPDFSEEESILGALKRGEEMIRNFYQSALLHDDVATSCKAMIREELLPPVIEHISSLERLDETACAGTAEALAFGAQKWLR
jgi:hypothetical protein